MTRRLLAALLVSSLALVTAGCGAKSDSGGAPVEPERRFLSLGSAPTGGAFFVVGGALAEVASAAGPAGWQVNNEATKGSRENIRRLVQHELDFALANAAVTYFAVRGESGWDKGYDVKNVMTLAPNVALFVAPAKSGIESIADLEGKRVIIGPAGAGFEMFVAPILEAHGLRYEDMTALNNTQSEAADMLGDGSADAAFLGGAVPTASITQAATSMDLRLIPFDETARQKLIADFTFFEPATIPGGTYRGQDADYAGLDVGSMHLIVAGDTDEELVYQMTKTLWESRDKVVERHPAGRAINPKNAVRDVGTPFHPGAERYYREIGIWPGEAPAEPASESPGPATEPAPAAEAGQG